MPDLLNAITWDVDPVLFSIGGLEIRYYGAFFGIAFLLGYQVLKKMFQSENVDLKILDRTLIFVMIGVVVGARLGHVLFYGPYFTPDGTGYFDDPITILYIREGGLASHGAAIGVLLMLVWLVRREKKRFDRKYYLWILDRIVVTVALGSFFIRMGNLMNHEIVGMPTDAPWGFIFTELREGNIVRHPAQLYEAICYLITFGILMFMFWKTKLKDKPGAIFGWYLILAFFSRFLVEFVKKPQTHFVEEGVIPAMRTGQLLSIPLIIIGAVLIVMAVRKYKNKSDDDSSTPEAVSTDS